MTAIQPMADLVSCPQHRCPRLCWACFLSFANVCVPFDESSLHSRIAGFLPFSAIYIELYYIFASVWGHKVRSTVCSILKACHHALYIEHKNNAEMCACPAPCMQPSCVECP